MIDAFATFFLLSYAKLLFICIRTVMVQTILNVNNGTFQEIRHLSSDLSVEFLSNEHIPFVILSISIFLLTILPLTLLLALYPIKFFRLLLFKCLRSSRIITALNIFVEKFYSSYRGGPDGKRDMRGFIVVYFLLRPIHLAFSQLGMLRLISILYICCSVLVAIARPYRKGYMNNTDILILTNVALVTLFLDGLLIGEKI